ncbi:MAG: hypothetical protein EHM72_19330, partial [Calditrichaeota bacterium]
MKVIIMLVPILLTYSLLAQKMTIKDSEENVLLEVNDEGASGSIFMPAGTAAPTGMVNKLYNLDGNLYWNGAVLSENDVNWIRENDDLYTPVIGHVGIGTEIPLSSLHVLGNDGALFEGTFGEGTITREGAGTRLMWIPKKAALRALGSGTLAAGGRAFTAGYITRAIGDYSTAMGRETKADALSSTVFGQYNVGGGNTSDWIAADPLFEIGNGSNDA